MKTTVRLGEGNIWGFVEEFKTYRYGDTGSITVKVGVGGDGKFVKPYILRKGVFIPMSEIEKEGDCGVSAYMKAKKPIYSLLSDGFIINLKCYLDYTKGTLIPEKSHFDVYSVKGMTPVTAVEAKLTTIRLMEIPDALNELALELMGKVVEIGIDREKFLRSRF